MWSFIHLERVNGERSLVHRICMKYKSYVFSGRFKLNIGFPVYVRGYSVLCQLMGLLISRQTILKIELHVLTAATTTAAFWNVRWCSLINIVSRGFLSFLHFLATKIKVGDPLEGPRHVPESSIFSANAISTFYTHLMFIVPCIIVIVEE